MPDRKSRGLYLALVVTVAAAVVSALVGEGWQSIHPLLVGSLGALYVVVGVFVHQWLEHHASGRTFLYYYAFQTVLGYALIIAAGGRGLIVLLLFPLVAQSVIDFSTKGAYLFSALLTLALGGLMGWWGALSGAVWSTLSFAAGLVFVIAFTDAAGREMRMREEVERLNEELAEANRKLREHAAQAQELAVANERNRLAREIHDSLGHYLTVINVQLEASCHVFEHDPQKAVDAVRKAQSLAQEGLADIRRSVATLRRSPLDDQSLAEAIEQLVAELRGSGVVTQFQLEGDLPPLSPQTELALYRAVQEALTNVRKHAHASRADVRLAATPDCLRLVVTDNGIGGDQADGGFGLIGVRERVQLLGGTFEARPGANGGFEFVVEVPN